MLKAEYLTSVDVSGMYMYFEVSQTFSGFVSICPCFQVGVQWMMWQGNNSAMSEVSELDHATLGLLSPQEKSGRPSLYMLIDSYWLQRGRDVGKGRGGSLKRQTLPSPATTLNSRGWHLLWQQVCLQCMYYDELALSLLIFIVPHPSRLPR